MSAALEEALRDHQQARVTLEGALRGGPSHAYLFHGPAGVGKRDAARAFAAELLAEGADDPESVRRRAGTGTHPDLTWVSPTGAHVMRTEDVDGPVVAAATRTPFESARRVFVLERVDTMNDEVANRLLKTLEEPASFVHLLLLTDSLGQVIPTVVSRCQSVRFSPLPAARIAESLESEGVPRERALACARLALGNGARARFLASEEGEALRADVDRMLAASLGSSSEGADASRGAGCSRARRRARPGRRPRSRASATRGWSRSRRGATAGRSRSASTRRRGATGAGPRPRSSTWGSPSPRSASATWSASPRGRRRPFSTPSGPPRWCPRPGRAIRGGCARPPSAARRRGSRSS